MAKQTFNLHQLNLEYFKGFQNASFELATPFTLIIGDNGKGKTVILEAISIVMSHWLLGFDLSEKENLRQFLDDDIYKESVYLGEMPDLQSPNPALISCDFIINENPITCQLSRDSSGKKTDDQNFKKIAKNLQEKVNQEENLLLPLIAYYGTDRLWKIPDNDKTSNGKKTIIQRTDGYLHCLRPASNLKGLIEFLKQEEKQKQVKGKASNYLLVIQDALEKCLQKEGWTKITYTFLGEKGRGEAIAENHENGQFLPIRMLSDGVRNMLVMVADIAYRCAVLNPHLGINAAQETPGIVLIDEIDLHLHPKWQRRVVEELHQAFPKIQFIATTHSPFIIQSLRLGTLINLDSDEPVEYYNQTIEDITNHVMNVKLVERSKRYQDQFEIAKKFLEALEKAKEHEIEKLERELDRITMPYTDDPAYHAFLERKLLVEATKRGK